MQISNLKMQNENAKFKMLKCGGFTLMEVLLAVFIVTTAMGAAFAVIYRTVSFYPIVSSRLTAAYLAQEGIEIVRNIRDTNYLQTRTASADWDDGIPAGDWEADYTTVTFANTANFETCVDTGWNCDDYDGDFLRTNGDGFYGYSGAGALASFQRRITIDKSTPEVIGVSVLVSWQGKGQSYQLAVQEDLYNWK